MINTVQYSSTSHYTSWHGGGGGGGTMINTVPLPITLAGMGGGGGGGGGGRGDTDLDCTNKRAKVVPCIIMSNYQEKNIYMTTNH